jgi:hypothetical protein
LRKRIVGLPGSVSYFYATKDVVENAITGDLSAYYVITSSLMEFSLEALVDKWMASRDMSWGSDSHILACQYIIGSILQALLALRQLDSYNSDNNQAWVLLKTLNPSSIYFDLHRRVHISDFENAVIVDRNNENVPFESIERYDQNSCASKNAPHPTMNLHSVGKLVDYIRGSYLDEMAPHWEYARRHLVQNLCRPTLDDRAFFDHCRNHKNAQTEVVRLILSHPYFWDLKKSLAFLTDLTELLLDTTRPEIGQNVVQLEIHCLQIMFGLKPNHELVEAWQVQISATQEINHEQHILQVIRHYRCLSMFPQFLTCAWNFVLNHPILRNLQDLSFYFDSPYQPSLDAIHV